MNRNMTDPSIGSSSPNWASLISKDITSISASDIPASTSHNSNTAVVPPGATQDLPLLMDSLNAGMSPYAPVFHPTGSYASHLLQLEQTAQSNPQLLPTPPPHPVDPNLEEFYDRSPLPDMSHQKATGFTELNGNTAAVDLTIRMTPTVHTAVPNQNLRGNWRETPVRDVWPEEAAEASQLHLQQEYLRHLHQQIAATVESQQHLRSVPPSRNVVNEMESDGIALSPQLSPEQIALLREHWQHVDQQLAAIAAQIPPHLIPPPSPLEIWRELIAYAAQNEVPTAPQVCRNWHDVEQQTESSMGLPPQAAIPREHWRDVDQQASTATIPFQAPVQDLPAPHPFELASEDVPQVTVFVPPPLPPPHMLLGPPQCEWRTLENKYSPEEFTQQLHRENIRESDQQAVNSAEPQFSEQQEVYQPPTQNEWLPTPKMAKIVVSVEPQVRPGPTHGTFWPENEQAAILARKYCQNMSQKPSQGNAQTPGQSVPMEQVIWRDMDQAALGATTPPHLLPEPAHREWWQASAFTPQPAQVLIHSVQPMQSVEPKQSVQPVNPVQSVQPAIPVHSVQLVQPVIPVQLVQPVQPVQSVNTVQSVQPVQPVIPIQPVQLIQPVNSIQSIQSVQSMKSAQPMHFIHTPQSALPVPSIQPVQSRKVETKLNWMPYAYANPEDNNASEHIEESILPNSAQKHTQDETPHEAAAPKAPIHHNVAPAPSPDYPSFEDFAKQVSECSLSSSEYIATLRNLMIRAHNLMLPLLRGRFANMSQVQMAAYTTAILEVTPLHPSLFLPPNVSRPWMGNGGLLPPCHPHSLTPQDLARINARPLRVHTGTQTDYHCWCMHISMFPPPPLPRAPGNAATHFAAPNGTRMMSPCNSAPLSFWGRSMVPMHHPHTHPFVQAHQLPRPHGSRYGYRYTYSVPSRFTATGNGRSRPQLGAMYGAVTQHVTESPTEESVHIEPGNSAAPNGSLPIPSSSSTSVTNEQQQAHLQQQQHHQQQQHPEMQQQAPLHHVGSYVSRCSSPSMASVDLGYSVADSNDIPNNNNNNNNNFIHNHDIVSDIIMDTHNVPNEQLNSHMEDLSAPSNRQVNLEEIVAPRASQDHPINEAAAQVPESMQAQDNSNESSGKKAFVKRFHDLFLQPTGPVMPSMPSVHYYSGTLAQRGRQSDMPHMIYDMNGDYPENAHYFQFLPNVNLNMNANNSMQDVRVMPPDVPDNVCPIMPEMVSTANSGLMPATEHLPAFKPNGEDFQGYDARESTLNESLTAANPNMLNMPMENPNPIAIANDYMANDYLASNEDNFNGFINTEEFTNGNMTLNTDHPTTECDPINKFSTAKL